MNSSTPTIDHDILINAYYVIDYFNEKDTEVTNLKLQKLMYFLEAIYMVMTHTDSMFYEDFYAWAYGPVSKTLYDKFRIFESLPIELTEEERKIGRSLNDENKKYIRVLFELLGSYKAYQLVDLTHVEGSPWYEAYQKNKSPDKMNTDEIVSKLKTREWFKEYVILDET